MRFSTRTTSATQSAGALRLRFLMAVLMVLAAGTASAQTTAVPATTAIQMQGVSSNTPQPINPPTAPKGGIILYGDAISPITGQNVRHLWVGDTNFGLCRVDPDLDSGMATLNANLAMAPQGPSPFFININQCPFKVNGFSVTGGPMDFDPVNNFLYFVDEQNSSQGIFRIGYLPSADSGQGALDFNNIFGMAGNVTGSRFSGGQSGCSFPPDVTVAPPAPNAVGLPDGLALDPLGNVWLSFKKSGSLIRINSPATATSVGFGTCADFVQQVGESPTQGRGNGIAFIGHDLWGADASPFVITNADTTCQAMGGNVTTPACVGTNPADMAGVAPADMMGDQTYPNLNGNNLYFTTGSDVIWTGNVAAGAPTRFTLNPFEPAGAFNFTDQNGNIVTIVNVNGLAIDSTDTAQIVPYSGDDPSGLATLAAGRWWQLAQNPAPPAAPGAPTVVRALPGPAQATVSWSEAQIGEPVTSYTIVTTASDGSVVPNTTVLPPAGGTFPPNFAVVTGLTNSTGVPPSPTYTFQVSATNGNGTSALSAPSNTVLLPGVAVPGIPTNIAATAGDGAAFVSWVAPPNAASQNITSFLITSHPGGIIDTVNGATATNGIVAGLTNGVNYTFTVHATNAGGNGLESTPSNVVTPGAKPVISVNVGGPTSVNSTPIQVTYPVTITNTSVFPVNLSSVLFNLTEAAPSSPAATLLVAQTNFGSCGSGNTQSLTCTLGSLAAGQVVTINVIAQIQSNNVTLNAAFTGSDTNSNAVTASGSQTTTVPPPGVGGGTPVAVTVTASTQSSSIHPLVSTNHIFGLANTTSDVATSLVLTITEPAGITVNSVSATSNLASDPFTCNPPTVNADSSTTILCTIANFGGNNKNGAKPKFASSATATVKITANALPKGTTSLALVVKDSLSFNGVDTLPNTASFTQNIK